MENTQEFDFASLPIAVSYVAETVKDNNWPCDQWRVVIGEGKAQFVTDYFTGLGMRRIVKDWQKPPIGALKNSIDYKRWEKEHLKPARPDNKGIMYSLLIDSEAVDYCFNDWCDNFGYDPDSISAFNIYQQCCKIGEQLRKVFSHEQIKQMRIALEGY